MTQVEWIDVNSQESINPGPDQAGDTSSPDSLSGRIQSTKAVSGLRRWAFALAIGLAAGVVAWIAGELTHGYFRPRLHEVTVLGMTYMQPSRESRTAADLANSTLVAAILGGVVGLTMGFAGGLAGRSHARGAIVGMAGFVGGSLAGALTSVALVPLFFRRLVPDQDDLLTPIFVHGGIWAAIGALGALAFSFGMVRRQNLLSTVLVASCCGFVASVVYHFLGDSLFLDSRPMDAIAGSSSLRFLSMVLPATFIIAGAAGGSLGQATISAESPLKA
jgi:hypothetical protein